MERNYADFVEKFALDTNTIYKNAYWTWSVRPIPTTLGASVLSLNRPAERFSAVTPEEAQALSGVIGLIEATLGCAFSPEKFNYLMLMMVDLHVHFHIVPRYSQTVAFCQLEWIDDKWPGPPELGRYEGRATPDILGAVRDELMSKIPGQST
jgi:diadenosine tetraphosphate (Ap4A) HIT family hydrolase